MSFCEKLVAKIDSIIVKFILWYLKDKVSAPIETREISIHEIKHIRDCCVMAMVMPIGGLAVAYSMSFLPIWLLWALYIYLIIIPILGIRDVLRGLKKRFQSKDKSTRDKPTSE